jgi:hypothetical protein
MYICMCIGFGLAHEASSILAHRFIGFRVLVERIHTQSLAHSPFARQKRPTIDVKKTYRQKRPTHSPFARSQT